MTGETPTSSEQELGENDEFRISSTSCTRRVLHIFRNNNNDDNAINNNNTMMVCIQNLGDTAQNISVEMTSTSSTFTTRISMRSNQNDIPNIPSSDDYESDDGCEEESDVDNNDRDDTSPDNQDNSNTDNDNGESTDTALSVEEIETLKPITDDESSDKKNVADEENNDQKRALFKIKARPRKRVKNEENNPDR
ncbi:PREDICTED: dr1-associated corepressor homolog [Papilio xuthus]|uniref:Dr1-associated corepressor homolog n=1 Tax=Papilio xuthus TaxID=66420 RepID=A0A194PQG5_PAPXU|nr:PREDICTED: dr1-associated corepressor homolog [Papilio xuthus]KPI95691.1 hypothetical protein RR46_11404 [Papilio xuthus]